MWLTAPNRIGIAAWQTGDSIWRIDARGGPEGVNILVGDQRVTLAAPRKRVLPRLDEQFVRGDELHLSFPQAGEGVEFGFRLVIRPVDSQGSISTDRDRAAFELLVSIQTTLLDSHPAIELLLPASGGVRSETVQDADDPDSVCRVLMADNADCRFAVILGPQDIESSIQVDEHGVQRLTLFGEFLEKGVIRRARPWVMMDRSGGEIDTRLIRSATDVMADSPLPLN